MICDFSFFSFNWELKLVTNSACKPVICESVSLSPENFLWESYSRLNAENLIFS